MSKFQSAKVRVVAALLLCAGLAGCADVFDSDTRACEAVSAQEAHEALGLKVTARRGEISGRLSICQYFRPGEEDDIGKALVDVTLDETEARLTYRMDRESFGADPGVRAFEVAAGARAGFSVMVANPARAYATAASKRQLFDVYVEVAAVDGDRERARAAAEDIVRAAFADRGTG